MPKLLGIARQNLVDASERIHWIELFTFRWYLCRFHLSAGSNCCWSVAGGGGAHFTDVFALGLWLLESAKESDRLPQTSLAFLDFSATGEWHPARPVAVVGASALHPEVAWSSYCCWSAVGGRVAAGGLVAVVVPVCGVGAWGGSASANSQPCEKLRAKKRFRARCFSCERAFYNH